jgi:tetratricopeptide (TPR) repeat protein
MIEDGIAPLGGTQASKPAGEAPTSVREMLQDPMRHLHEIHEEATRLLKENNVVDAQRLFEVVLQCQRHRHGPLHPDVASALHNLGITQLRAQNHAEALKSFEEAARVRKGSLGKDHALVAV